MRLATALTLALVVASGVTGQPLLLVLALAPAAVVTLASSRAQERRRAAAEAALRVEAPALTPAQRRIAYDAYVRRFRGEASGAGIALRRTLEALPGGLAAPRARRAPTPDGLSEAFLAVAAVILGAGAVLVDLPAAERATIGAFAALLAGLTALRAMQHRRARS